MVLVKTENGTKIPMKVNLLAVDDLKRHVGVWEDIDRTIDQCFLTAYGHPSKMFLNVGEYGPHPKYMAHPCTVKNSISIASAVFAALGMVTHRHTDTDHATPSVAKSPTQVVHAMWPGKQQQ